MLKRKNSRFQFKLARKIDIKRILEIEKKSSPSPWKKRFFYEEMEQKNSFCFIVSEQESNFILGFVIFREFPGFIEINNIAVDQAERKKGVGSFLLSQAEDHASRNNLGKIYLEVRKSNSGAISFYKKKGFDPVSERLNYYKNPVEDALIFEKCV